MTDNSMERQTLLGFGAAAALLVLLSLVAIFSVRGYEVSVRWVTHTYEVITELEGLSASLSAAEAARRGFLASGDASYLDERSAALSDLQRFLQTAQTLTIDNPEQHQALQELEELVAQRTEEASRLLTTVGTEGLAAAQQAFASQPTRHLSEQTSASVERIVAVERNLLIERRTADQRSRLLLLLTSAALLLTAGTVLTWLCWRIRHEMRERASALSALHHANAGLQSANRELESFSYSVSHDLRAPLRAIDGYSQMLEEDYGTYLDETAHRYIQTVRHGSQRMAALIDDLLTFSRLSRQNLVHQTVDMTALARRAAAEILEGQPEPKPAVQIGELPAVRGDPALLRQVWTNLIANAIKYSSKCPRPQVQIRAARDGDLVRYEVQDNGVGFDMKYAGKLFGVFQRLHGPDEYPGTGVGLAIVQRIVNRHAGVVSAQGECGKGATFGFALPREI